MPLAGLVVNRASPATPHRDSRPEEAIAAAARLRAERTRSLTAGCCGCTPTGCRMVEREARLRERFAAAHPQVPTAVVPALPGDVHDLDGLRQVGAAAGRQLSRRSVRSGRPASPASRRCGDV